MYSITERPEHLSGADLKDIKTKLYYEQLLEYLAFPMLHCALDLQPHYTTQHLQCGFYTNHSRVVLWVPVQQTFSLTEILNHIQTALREQCPKLIDEITANSCISGFTLELARSHLNNKN